MVSTLKMRCVLIAAIVVCSVPASVLGKDWDKHFKTRANELFPEAKNLREQLHGIPEPCFNEKKTAAFVAQALRKLGLEVTQGVGGTGVKAVLRGKRPGPVIGLRADMDALPLQEATGLAFASRTPGLMHACGHDMHMANLLMAAKLLAEVKKDLPGTVVFLFQPCEEGAPGGEQGGADAMIAAGALGNPPVEAMLGLHLMPDMPSGTIGLRSGPIMANVAQVRIELLGKASHGALPHQGIDAVHAAAQAIVQFQSIISRLKDPGEKAVISIGMISGGVRYNVIAEQVEMEGTVRTFSDGAQDMIELEMEKILKGLELVYGAHYKFEFIKLNRYVKNDPGLVRFFTPVFQSILGADHVIEVEPMTIGEDFASYSHRLPSLFFFLGVGAGAQPAALHTPLFSPDENALRFSPALLAAAAMRYLKSKKK